MREMDIVEITIEKERYAKEGIHKGMQGWICCDRVVDGYWLVNFPQCGEKDDVAEISVHESDMKQIPEMDARLNEMLFQRYGSNFVPSLNE